MLVSMKKKTLDSLWKPSSVHGNRPPVRDAPLSYLFIHVFKIHKWENIDLLEEPPLHNSQTILNKNGWPLNVLLQTYWKFRNSFNIHFVSMLLHIIVLSAEGLYGCVATKYSFVACISNLLISFHDCITKFSATCFSKCDSANSEKKAQNQMFKTAFYENWNLTLNEKSGHYEVHFTTM